VKQVEIAKYFDVSRATVADWKRQGCPLDGDLGTIAGWKTARELERGGIVSSGLPVRVAEHARRRADLDQRIEQVNAWPPGTEKKPNLLKVATVCALTLERTLLDLPVQLLAAGPDSVPECFFSVVFDALDEARGEGAST
jgi:hypothetical protein